MQLFFTMKDIKITIQKTTNKTIIKFVSNSILVDSGSYEFNNIKEAEISTLSQELFHLPFVKKIFISANFIAIQCHDIIEWKDVEEEVREQIEDYLQKGNKIINKNSVKNDDFIDIYVEETPNPAVIKFNTNKELTETDVEIKSVDEAEKSSPFALNLFDFPFIKEVFISENYISVTKHDNFEWENILNETENFIKKYLQDKKTIISKNFKKPQFTEVSRENLDETSLKIIDILDEYIKPAVSADGGNIVFESYDENTKCVNVILQGACSGCPASILTLKGRIEIILKKLLPNKIESVVASNG